MKDDLNSINLVADIKSGDAIRRNKAYATIYNNSTVRGKIIKMANESELYRLEPDDLLQDAILELDRKILDGTFRGESTVITFLIGICKYMIWDLKKNKTSKKVVYKGVFTDADCGSPEAVSNRFLGEFEDPLQLAERQQIESEIEVENGLLVTKLREECQKALKLKYLDGWKMREIAPEVNVKNENQAKKLIDRCRQQLRDLCKESPVMRRLFNLL